MLLFSGTIRLMQRPVAMRSLKVEGGGGAVGFGSREEEEEARKGKRERPLGLFIRRMDKQASAGIEELEAENGAQLLPRSSEVN